MTPARWIGLALLVCASVALCSDGARGWLRSRGLLWPRGWDPGYQWRLRGFERENPALPAECTVLLGDSLTELFPRKLLADRTRVIRGISGDRIADVARRIDVSALRTPCATVALLVGSNDVVFGAAGADETVAALLRLADALAAGGKQVLLHTLPPTRGTYASALPRIERINAGLHAAMPRAGVALVDLSGPLGDPDGSLRAAFTTDGLHLTEAGYAAWSRVLLDAEDRIARGPAAR